MTKFVGRRGSLGIALETSRGVGVSPAFWIPYVTMSFKDTIESAREAQGMGKIADSDSVYVTMKMGEGEIESQLYDQALGYILSSLMGALPSTSGSGTYTHTFTLQNSNQQKSLSLFWHDPDRDYLFPLAVVDSVQCSVEANGIVSWTIGFKSKTARNWATQTPSYTTMGSKFLHQHVQPKVATNLAGLSAASVISVKTLEFTINRNTIFDSVIGTVEPEDILGQELSVEGKLNLNLTDDTWRNLMLGNTYQAMELKFNAAANSSLTFQFPRVDFSEWDPDFSLGDIAKQDINFKANYDSAGGNDIISTATLVNTKSSYP